MLWSKIASAVLVLAVVGVVLWNFVAPRQIPAPSGTRSSDLVEQRNTPPVSPSYVQPGDPVRPSSWYEGAFCDPLIGVCSLKSCDISPASPAQLYERNRAYGDARIIDKGDEVDVIAQGATIMFFKTSASCMGFVSAQAKIQENKQKQESEILNKYR